MKYTNLADPAILNVPALSFTDIKKCVEGHQPGAAYNIIYRRCINKDRSKIGVAAGYDIWKVVLRPIRTRISYGNQKEVQRREAEGELNRTHQLKGVQWTNDPNEKDKWHLINAQGEDLIRVYPYPITETHYFVDGLEVDEDDVIQAGVLRPSSLKENTTCLNLKAGNVIDIQYTQLPDDNAN